MRSSAAILTIVSILIGATSLDSVSNQTTTIKEQENENIWIWGYVVDVEENRDYVGDYDEEYGDYVVENSTEKPTVKPQGRDNLKSEENPCEKAPPPMPNYSAPGKRISEQKCEEYLWMVRNRLDRRKLLIECVAYKIAHGLTEPVPVINRGRDAKPGEFPHMGAIGWEAVVGTWIFKCGGILISSKFVLTAAHCSRASGGDTRIKDFIPKIVRFGDKNIKDLKNNDFSAVTSIIINIIVHPKYKSPKKYNDIALIELEKDLIFQKNIQPACLWHQFDTKPLGKKATVTGWGEVEAFSRETSAILQVADLDIIDSQQCDALLRPRCNRLWCGIEDTQICAGILKGGADACRGDSGGPLQVKIPLPDNFEGAMHYVIGVTSFGFDCARENSPGVYTRVSEYLDWIESYVWK